MAIETDTDTMSVIYTEKKVICASEQDENVRRHGPLLNFCCSTHFHLNRLSSLLVRSWRRELCRGNLPLMMLAE